MFVMLVNVGHVSTVSVLLNKNYKENINYNAYVLEMLSAPKKYFHQEMQIFCYCLAFWKINVFHRLSNSCMTFVSINI